MNIDTGAFQALRDDVAAIKAALERAATLDTTTSVVMQAAYDKGRYDERQAIMGGSEGRAGRPGRHRGAGSAAGHLRAVEAERRPS